MPPPTPLRLQKNNPWHRALDFFGDIHGQAHVLERALRSLGYQCRRGVWQHEGRRTVFLGDILNRGPEILETTRIIRPMVDQGQAVLLLGNHEWYALREAGEPAGWASLPEKARHHLQATKAAFGRTRGEWSSLLRWLWQRPLFFDNGRVRGIHACWDPRSLSELADNKVRSEDLLHAGSVRFQALCRILEGPTVRHLESGVRFRIRWWERRARHWADFAYRSRAEIPREPLPVRRLRMAAPYGSHEPPLFFGHYGFPKPCGPLQKNLACLDLAVAQGGPIAVYCWDGESALNPQKFHSFA